MISLMLYAGSTLLAFFLVRNAAMFAAAHVICGTISGFWLTATAPLRTRLLPKQKFAIYTSALGIFVSAGGMVAGLVVGWLMDALNPGRTIDHYDFRYMYLWASAFAGMSLAITWIVYRRFLEFGGSRNYVAPE